MRTNIEMDDALVEEAKLLTGLRTKRAVVHEALMVLIRSRKRKSLCDLKGRLRFSPGFDYKSLREERQ